MRPLEDRTLNESDPPVRRRNFEFFYYEQLGSRLYLRFTRLGVIAILVFTLIPISAILLLFLFQEPAKEVNVNITTPPERPYDSNKSIIKAPPPSPAFTPKPIRQTPVILPTPPLLPSPDRNRSETPTVKPSPKRTPDRSSNQDDP